MAMLLKTNGGFEMVYPKTGDAFTLAELQGFVGGYIEIVRAPGEECLVLNQDGKQLALPRNPEATLLYHAAGGRLTDVVVGDVLVGTWSELGGEGR